MLEQLNNDVGRAAEGHNLGIARSQKQVPELGESGNLTVALRCIGQQGRQLEGDVLGCESILQELWNDAPSSDEVGHGDGKISGRVGHVGELFRVSDQALRKSECEGRDAVNDNERVSHNGSEYGRRPAGDNRGAGVVEGFPSVRHKS